MTDQDDLFGDISDSLAGESADNDDDGDRSSATSIERTTTSESATASSSQSASSGPSSIRTPGLRRWKRFAGSLSRPRVTQGRRTIDGRQSVTIGYGIFE